VSRQPCINYLYTSFSNLSNSLNSLNHDEKKITFSCQNVLIIQYLIGIMVYNIMCKIISISNENIIIITKKNVFTTNNNYGN